MSAQSINDFNRLPQRTAADLQKLWTEEPAAAAQWAAGVAEALPNPPAEVAELSKLLETAGVQRDDATAAFKKFFDEKGKSLAEALLNPTPAATAAPVMKPMQAQLLARIPPTPPSITGTLSMNGTTPTLNTPKGSFTLVGSDQASGNFLGTYDVQAFVGQTVTVKAWPTATAGMLAVEEFAPGDMANFVSGRVEVDGAKTRVRVKGDKSVEITDPALAKLLAAKIKLGVILPGAVKSKNGALVFEGKPDAYYILTRVNQQPTTTGNRGAMQIQMGHGQNAKGNFDSGVVPADMMQRARCFLFGAFGDNGEFEVKGVTQTAGGFNGDGQRVTPKIDYAFAATMASAHTTADLKEAGFTLAGAASPPAASAAPFPLVGFRDAYHMNTAAGLPLAQALGPPIGPEAANGAGGALMQKFEHGLMTYTPNVGISALDANGQIIFKNF